MLVLKTICDQILIALNNAGLRRLVKSLSVTDERSGLLKRASYLDLLMAETRRNTQQSTSLSILLLQFGEKAAMLKEFGEAAIEALMQQIGQLFAANIRQNDLAFRYEATSIAIVLGETTEKEGILAAEKLQRLVAQIKLPEKDEPVRFNAGTGRSRRPRRIRSGRYRHRSRQSRRTGGSSFHRSGRRQSRCARRICCCRRQCLI